MFSLLLKKDNLLGITMGLVAALGWGSIGLWIKNISLEAVQIATLRLVISAIFLSVFSIGLKRGGVKLTKKIILKSSILGLILAFQLLTTIYAYKALFISEATTLTNIHLLFIILLLLPVLLRKKRILVLLLFGFISLMSGIFLIFGFSGQLNFFGSFMGISASFLFALYTILLEKFFPTNPHNYLSIIFTSGAMVMLFILLITSRSLLVPATINWFSLIMLLLFSTIIAHVAYILAISKIGSIGAGIISYFAILFGFLIDSYLRGVSTPQGVGGLLTFISLCFLFFIYSTRLDPKKIK